MRELSIRHPWTRAVRGLPSLLRSAPALLLGLAAALAAPSTAAVGEWTPLGPDGGEIRHLAGTSAQGGAVLAATPGSVFRSLDGGDSWQFAGEGIGPFAGVRTLAVDGQTAYVGTSYEGASRSDDLGRTWRSITAGLGVNVPRPQVEALVVDPRHAGWLWAGTSEGVSLSRDRGDHWESRTNDLPAPNGVIALAIHPQTGELYATTFRNLFASDDDGGHWRLLSCGLRSCGQVVLDPARPGTLYASQSGILLSRDDGATWTRLRGPRNAGALQPLAVHDGRLFAVARSYVRGNPRDLVYYSDDLGAHFVAAAQQPNDPSLGGFAAVGDTLFIGSSGDSGPGGVFRSRDGGQSWERANAGLSARWINDVAPDPLQPGVLYAKAANHLFRSGDDGGSWQLILPSPNLLSFGGEDILVDPTVARRVWSASFYLQRSDDGGRRWTTVRPVGFPIETLAADPGAPGSVWAGGGAGLFHSVNGRGWKRIRPAGGEDLYVVTIAVDPLDPRVVWAGGFGVASSTNIGARLFRSGDGGITWERRDAGLPGLAVTRVALHPATPGTLFAAADNGIFRSRDGGSSWQPLTAPIAGDGRWELTVAPGAPATLYAFRLDSEAVFGSRDDGATWRRLGTSDGGWGRSGVRSLTVDPLDPRRLFAGTAQRGIYTWTEP
jgi:photosystem II stability/assembly factor-like uncharacterized protein